MMSDEELEDAFIQGMPLWIYTSRIGHFIACRVSVLHWAAKSDAFIVEAIADGDNALDQGRSYWIQRSDASLIIKPI
jgi:hypothetical protein